MGSQGLGQADKEPLMEFSGVPKKKLIRMGKLVTADVETGKVLEVKQNAGMLLPCAPDVCQECAMDHPHENPHNQQSLYYQMRFHAQHGRWPTWTDAMAHCTEPVRQHWKQALLVELKKHRMAIPADLLEDTPGASR